MALETFTSYTEVDPSGSITVAANTITWTDLSSRDVDSYVYYDFGANYFGGDFTHRFVVSVTDMDTSIAFWFPWAIANSVNDLKGIDNAGESFIAFGVHNSGTLDFYLYVCESGNLSTDNAVNFSLSTDYYVTVARDDSAGTNSTGLLKAYICTGAHFGQGGVLVSTLTYNCKAGEQNNFRYLYATNMWDTDMSNKDISGTVSNMELKSTFSTTTTTTSSSTSSTASTTSSTSSTASTSSTSSTASSTSSTSSTASTTSSTSSTASTSSTGSTTSSSSSSSSSSTTSSTASTTSSTSSTASTSSTSSTASSTTSSTSTTSTPAPEGDDSEIWHNYLTGLTLYACRFNVNGYVYLADGSFSESWGSGGNDADDYDVPMTEQGTLSGHYTCKFDTSGNIAAGIYGVTVYLQTGANPVDADPAIAEGEIYWDGDSEVTVYSINTTLGNNRKRYGPWL